MTKFNLFPNRTVVFSGDLFEFAKFEDNQLDFQFDHSSVIEIHTDIVHVDTEHYDHIYYVLKNNYVVYYSIHDDLIHVARLT